MSSSHDGSPTADSTPTATQPTKTIEASDIPTQRHPNSDIPTQGEDTVSTVSSPPCSMPSSASSGISMASDSSISVSDLPASAYDGSHLHWKAFRQHVLNPHRIRVQETPPKGALPDVFLSLVDSNSRHLERFIAQRTCFREQITEGRGFGPSPLFPPNLLPSIESLPHLARCMVPSFSRDALPDRVANISGPLYELSVPRPGLGCGFSSLAFSNEEINLLPSSLIGTGTSVDFSTGYISPSHAIYCPYLVFERAYGKKEHRLEAANNQCAIGGAYCCRAIRALFARAYTKERIPFVCSFTCTIDNEFAIFNFHWIADDDSYQMAPLCKFDLRMDDHFSHFAAWNEAIGEWASTSLLPQVKAAIVRLRKTERQSPGFVEMKAAKQLSLSTESNKNDMLIQSLKTTFDNIPWRFEDNEFTPVSSATATWGSPMVDDMLLSNLPFSTMRGLNLGSQGIPTSPRAALEDVPIKMDSSYLRPAQPPTPPTYNAELVSLKRLDHAMDEIRELHAGLEAIKDSSTDVKTQLSDLRDTLGSILRKESNNIRTRTVLTRRFSGSDLILSSPTDGPVAPISRPQNLPSVRHKREPLQIRTDLTPPLSNLRKSSVPPATPPELTFSSTSTGSTVSIPRSASPAAGNKKRTTPTLTLSCNGIDLLLSPRSLRRQPAAPLTGSFDSHKSPLSARAPAWPRGSGDLHSPTPITTQYIGIPPLPSPPKPKVQKETQTSPRYPKIEHSDITVSIEDNSSWLSFYDNAPSDRKVIIRAVATVAAGYLLTTIVPSALIKWFVVGCAADYCLRTVTGSKTSFFGKLGSDVQGGGEVDDYDHRERETDEMRGEEAERRS